MEDTTWEQKFHALTHILTSPTTNPSLHSQYMISNQIPCYLNWDYPPLLCTKYQHQPAFFLRWEFSLFLKRMSRFGLPATSWRSKCPYYQPQPLVLAKGLEEGKWDDEGKRQYVTRRRLQRKRFRGRVNPWIAVLFPNLLVLSLFFVWNPFPGRI